MTARRAFLEHHLGKPFELGTTGRQMLAAPQGAVFIWCRSGDRYPHGLAQALGRQDLVIEGVGWVRPSNLRGRRGLYIVVDHFARQWLTWEQLQGLNDARDAGAVVSYS